MPPKVKFSKEQILQAALDLVINKGINALSVRTIAKELGSSVAPIYVNFKNTDELLNAVMVKVGNIVWEYCTKPYTKHGFFNIGIGQLLVARDYPLLFMDLIVKCPQAITMTDSTMEKMLDIMEKDEMLEGLTREQCLLVLQKMGLQTSGIAMALATNSSMSIDHALNIMEETACQIIYAEQNSYRLYKNSRISIDITI